MWLKSEELIWKSMLKFSKTKPILLVNHLPIPIVYVTSEFKLIYAQLMGLELINPCHVNMNGIVK